MAIQFGYVTMFAAVAPWATSLCLVNNILERKADAYKMMYEQRRDRWRSAQDIGAWYGIFEILTWVAVVTNVALLAFTSNVSRPRRTQRPNPDHAASRLTHVRRSSRCWQVLERSYGFERDGLATALLVLEHLLIMFKLGAQAHIPDSPLWVIKSQEYASWMRRQSNDLLATAAEQDEEAIEEVQHEFEEERSERDSGLIL